MKKRMMAIIPGWGLSFGEFFDSKEKVHLL